MTTLDTRIQLAALALQTMKVSAQQAVILAACTSDKPPTMVQLAELCHITTAAMTGTIDRMIRLGWVLRGDVEGDRRSIAITLTAAGQQVIADLNTAISTL